MDSQLILGRIRDEKERFLYQQVPLSAGYFFNQYQVIQRIENYFNSRFESGPLDDDGWTKPFYNINRKPCQIVTKEIDLDTKDIILRPVDGDFETAEIMSSELKQWMKDEGFAKDLNDFADVAPVYGSLVVKRPRKKGERLSIVDLKRFVLTNVSADTLAETDTIETHCMSRDEFQRHEGWDEAKKEDALALYDSLGRVDLDVDERYGWVKESELVADGSDTKMVYTKAVVTGATEVAYVGEGDKKTAVERGIVLYHEPFDPKDNPYREWHVGTKVPNRWLRMGFVELTFDAQVRINEKACTCSRPTTTP